MSQKYFREITRIIVELNNLLDIPQRYLFERLCPNTLIRPNFCISVLILNGDVEFH